MPRTADVTIDLTAGLVNFNGAGYAPCVQLPDGTLYVIYIDSLSDVVFRKSTDRGLSWSAPTVIFAGTATAVAVFYDRWAGLSTDKIHVAYQESATDDTLYRSIDAASSDTLSTQTTIFAGTSTASGGHCTIAKSRGTNIYCKTVIDAGAEGGFYRSTDSGGTWGSRTVDETIATTDQMILQPGFAADAEDMLAAYWDASADELSKKNHDDSANSWSETSLATGMVDQLATTAFPHFSAVCDHVNSRIVVIAWNGIDTANQDLRCWTFDEGGSPSAKTDVVTNGTDDMGCAALAIDDDTGNWHAYYVGKSDGSETYPTAVNIYTKVSKDSGSTWGPETVVTTAARTVRSVYVPAHFKSSLGPCPVVFHNDQTQVDELRCVAPTVQPRAAILIGG